MPKRFFTVDDVLSQLLADFDSDRKYLPSVNDWLPSDESESDSASVYSMRNNGPHKAAHDIDNTQTLPHSDDDFWTLITNETNRYANQSSYPEDRLNQKPDSMTGMMLLSLR
ncbi:hypothetical protein ABVT39_017214 [Epinephelus coioides]